MAGRFLAKRLNDPTRLLIAAAAALTILSIGLLGAGVQSGILATNAQTRSGNYHRPAIRN